MNHVENCVEDHVKYFKVCWIKKIENFKAWVVLQKKAWRDRDVTFWKHISQN